MELVDILVQELPKRGGWPDGADFAVQNYRDGVIKFGKNPIEIAISEKWNNELWQGEWHFSYQYDFICHEVSTDCREVIVLRGDYEAALAASKSELDGKELPAIIGRFVPIGSGTCGRMPFNVLTRVASDYMPPAWEGIRAGGEGYHVIEKAWRFEPVEWNGEGLPPVGCDCEYETKFDGWQKVRIELIKSEGIAFTWLANNQTYNGLDCVGVQKAGSFRPIRSEADKKRDISVNEMVEVYRNALGSPFNAMGELYDAIAAGKIPGIRID